MSMFDLTRRLMLISFFFLSAGRENYVTHPKSKRKGSGKGEIV